MATLSVTHPTLLDVSKRMDPNGNIDKIVEMLHMTNEVLEDAVFIEANQMTGHRTTVRTGLPAATWRKLYGGVVPGKSTTAQVTESMGMLEAYAEVDKALADLNGNTAAFRSSEDAAFIEGMNQEFVQTLFTGNEGVEPEAFTGFAPRFNAISGAVNGENVISGGSVSGADAASIYLVVWGPNTVHCIYPKGSTAGLHHRDLGEDTVGDSTTGYFQAYRTHYRWDAGLVVRDWRYVVRIANIDTSDLVKNAATGPDLIDLMTQALEQVKDLRMGRPAFYVNRTVRSFLRRQIANKVANSTLSMDEVAGRKVISFDGVPVRRVDGILSNESAIT